MCHGNPKVLLGFIRARVVVMSSEKNVDISPHNAPLVICVSKKFEVQFLLIDDGMLD